MGPRNVVSKNKKKMKSRKFFMSMCIQTHQEIIYQEYQATKHREKSSQLQQYYEQIVSKTQTELTIAKKDLDGMKKKHGELAERLSERSRQYQKLQSLYESLRRRCITPASFNGGGDASMIDQTASRLQNFTMNLTTGDVLHGQNSSNQGSRGQSPPERDFVFRPNNTPLLAEQSRFSLMLGTPNFRGKQYPDEKIFQKLPVEILSLEIFPKDVTSNGSPVRNTYPITIKPHQFRHLFLTLIQTWLQTHQYDQIFQNITKTARKR